MNESQSEISSAPDWTLLGAMLALIALGLLMIYSSSSDMGYRVFGDETFFFKRQLAWLAIGAVAMSVVIWLPHKHWMKLSIPIMAGTVLLLLILALFRPGRQLVGQSISPVELAKLAVVIYIGHWLSTKGDLLRKLPYGLLPFTIMIGVIAALVMAQPDISEALVIVSVAVAMFFLAGADVLQFAIGIGGGIAAFVLVVRQLGPAMDRLKPFMEDWQDPLASSIWQLRQGIIAIGSGGILGLGPGNGRMKYSWLPAAHTDSIFAIAGEELGLVGCLAFIGLFALVTYRGFRIAGQAPDHFGGLVASGISCWIAFQALVNLAVVTGTMPFTGIALPFVTFGGSSLVTCMIGVGILLSISRTTPTERPVP
jgi:cell division protein FtsW